MALQLAQQQKNRRATPGAPATGVQKMGDKPIELPPGYMGMQGRDKVGETTDDKGNHMALCCGHTGCVATQLHQCRIYQQFCLRRLEEVLVADRLPEAGHPLRKGTERPWVMELQRRGQYGQPYLTYLDYTEYVRHHGPCTSYTDYIKNTSSCAPYEPRKAPGVGSMGIATNEVKSVQGEETSPKEPVGMDKAFNEGSHRRREERTTESAERRIERRGRRRTRPKWRVQARKQGTRGRTKTA